MKNKNNIRLLWDIFLAFFKIGSFTFGGGYAMIPLIEREVITNKKWVSKEEVIDIFALSQSMPGAIAINSSTFIGYKIAGGIGSIVATLGVIIPSYLVIVVVAMFFAKFQNDPIVKAVFAGVRPAIVGLIFVAAISIGKASIKDRIGLIVMSVSVILVTAFNVNAIFVIIGGAIAGVSICMLYPKKASQIMKDRGEQIDIP